MLAFVFLAVWRWRIHNRDDVPGGADKLIAASSPYQALAWHYYFKFGFRDEELAYLEKSNIDFERKVAMVRFKPKGSFDWNPELAWKPKDSEERDVPIPNSLITMLRSWFDAHPHTRFVVGTANDRPNIKFLKALKSDWRRAGLNCGKCSGCLGKRKECQDAYLHKFRSTYLTPDAVTYKQQERAEIGGPLQYCHDRTIPLPGSNRPIAGCSQRSF